MVHVLWRATTLLGPVFSSAPLCPLSNFFSFFLSSCLRKHTNTLLRIFCLSAFHSSLYSSAAAERSECQMDINRADMTHTHDVVVPQLNKPGTYEICTYQLFLSLLLRTLELWIYYFKLSSVVQTKLNPCFSSSGF